MEETRQKTPLVDYGIAQALSQIDKVDSQTFIASTEKLLFRVSIDLILAVRLSRACGTIRNQ